ncbi:uncharacterized protein M437DRAFT_39800 [Aureobasidium melanogenum CBS 110374]|uniref:Uncharacterized protein n=1 Tax=Aureobasidium melanogenum (strain CBS 110374) TaxID=1043003 RepID=A0A074W1X0_AURM1|nr:uncharacterized protein M437DRAFT_39800 [Aureobasidium melanogenum CBS 110374]KEQ66793.1 hypothetical protein M437DRAFT_39800 [Aureobasidium melanogenum CBS 110374]
MGLRAELAITNQKLEQKESDMQNFAEERERLVLELDALRKEMESEKQRQIATEEERTTTLNTRLIEEKRLETKLATVEHERQEAALTIAKLTSEKDDSSKEFDALASQLESLTIELEQTKQSLVDNGTDSDSKLRTLEAQLQETLAENATLSKQSQLLRPTTPMNKTVSYGRSFSMGSLSQRSGAEDYFVRSESDFSDMGKVFSANEAVFVQKIKEHVDSLEHARDQLNHVYKQRFEAMNDERARREEQLESQHDTELEAARNKLRANYPQPPHNTGAKSSASTTPFDGHVDEFHMEDTRLASEHAERLANRKSQVQHHHNLQFQALSDEYDKKIAELLGEKDMLDSDLSIGPERFEEMSEQIDRLHSATNSPASIRHRPLRSQTSIEHFHGQGNQHLYRSIETYNPTARTDSPSFARPQSSSAESHTSLRRKSSHGRLSQFIGKMSPFSSSRSSRSSASGPSRPHTTGHRVVSTPPPSSRPEYSKHSISEGSSTIGRNSSRRPMTADDRQADDMDFSIAPERFEALREGQELTSEELSRRGSVVGSEHQPPQHKSPKILRHISGSIRRKMASYE